MKHIFALPFAALILASCGTTSTVTGSQTAIETQEVVSGDGTLTDATDPNTAIVTDAVAFDTAFNEFAALKQAQPVDSPANTAWKAIPSTGTADFTGRMFVFAGDPDREGILAVATTALTADFANDTISASHETFYGTEAGRIVRYDGEIAITQGRIGASVPNDVGFQINGTLESDTKLFTLDGALTGKLKATPLRGILATAEDDPDIIVDANGGFYSNSFVQIEAFRAD